ncbi:L,D-transpeptidase family protein [Streptomyces sp. NA04227]|uniref:L,D-transpeptidase n=1 Tax=Streptomyces sp. NA04227 TaxID=2742136 RepID=UPI0015913048|nr:Ig-like domain-containing protein [Streptomyces sp. NA04227]QKW06054.1 L,D-transpeptidase family protein [Streptomyces sp. NA04227]
MRHTPHIPTLLSCTVLAAALGAGLTACGGSDNSSLSSDPYDAGDQLEFGGPTGDKADSDKPLEISSHGGGRITDVTATDARGHQVAGALDEDGERWRSSAALEPGARYTVRVRTENEDGRPGRKLLTFKAAKADKNRGRLKVTLGPKSGQYGVGQPITAELSRPVKGREARATVESALRVDSTPAVNGAWYWVDAKTLHYRPRSYWPTHATVDVHSTLAGVKLGKNLWGAPSKGLRITTGDRVEAITDAASHTMTVYRNGRVIRELPVTTGKPGFDTRNGIKVVLAKEAFVRMRSSTVGIAAGSADSYDLPVRWAARVTLSGEYVHAAPWSVGSQGAANVSHGCTGMSTENAEWFFNTVKEGDIVKVVNSDGEMMAPFDNGFGDWNLSWSKWREGTALEPGNGVTVNTGKAGATRLSPRL